MRLGPRTIGPGRGLACGAPSSAWTAARIAGKILWLRPGVADTLIGGHVSSAADQSGAANDITFVAAVGNRPIQSTCAAANSVASWYFDGNDSGTTAGLIMPTAVGSRYTVFAACAFEDTAARCVVGVSASGGTRVAQGVSGAFVEDWKSGVAFSTDGPSTTTPLNLVYVQRVNQAPTQSVLYRNGVLTATSQPDAVILTPSGVLSVGSLGASQFFLGHFLELVITNTAATAGEIAAWNAYSLARYGV